MISLSQSVHQVLVSKYCSPLKGTRAPWGNGQSHRDEAGKLQKEPGNLIPESEEVLNK